MEPALSTDKALRGAFQKAPWLSEAAMLLAGGNALRNIPAHGDATMPEPDDWDDESSDTQGTLPSVLHAPRLGTRGLLLSLQMLVSETAAGDLRGSWIAPEVGWWVKEANGEWARDNAPGAKQLLFTAHLKPPAADDDDKDDES